MHWQNTELTLTATADSQLEGVQKEEKKKIPNPKIWVLYIFFKVNFDGKRFPNFTLFCSY